METPLPGGADEDPNGGHYKVHHKCTPHACTEGFIRPLAFSGSALKVRSQLGG